MTAFISSASTILRRASRLAESAVQAASRLRPNAGETHLARAQNLYRGYLDYDGALAELEVAAQSLPNDPRVFELKGYIKRRQGRWEESTQNLERAIELDPRNILHVAADCAVNYQAPPALCRRKIDVGSRVGHRTQRRGYEGSTRVRGTGLESRYPTVASSDRFNSGHKSRCDSSIADNWLICALAERDAAAAENALIAFGESPITLVRPRMFFSVVHS